MGSAGVREMHRLDTRKYLVGNFNTTFYWQAANIYRLGLGVDGFYDGGFADRHVYPAAEDGGRYIDIDYDTKDILDRVRAGVCLSNEIVMGRFTTALDGGIYIFDPIKAPDETLFYFRLALKYRFTNGLFGMLAVKTHKFTAEMLTLGIGYSFLL
jgi:hypothetical protein